jgi:hypothetical protein
MGMWSIPDIIRGKVMELLSGLCDGQAQVGALGLKVSGLVSLKDISLSDKDGNRWLEAGMVKIHLGNWPSLSPTIKRIEAEQPRLRVNAKDGKLSLPVRRPAGQSSGSRDALDLSGIAITDGAITIVESGGCEVVYDKLMFSAAKKGDCYVFSASRAGTEAGEVFAAEGRIVPKTLEIELSLKMKHAPKEEETALILALLKRFAEMLKSRKNKET